MAEPASALYRLRVAHRRVGAVRHAFAYDIASLFLDLDELPDLQRRLRLFSWNGWGPVAHRDVDHGSHDGGPLRPWAEARLASAGIAFDGGPIRLLAMPRVLGGLFNPLSLFYCHRRDGGLAAMIYEVHNTFGEHHAYVLPAAPAMERGTVAQACDKAFYVSPFMPMHQRYSFRLRIPGERLSFAMRQGDGDGPLMFASMTGRRVALSDAALARLLLANPALSWKVLGAIHWQALKLWAKGAVYRPRPGAGGRVAPARTQGQVR